MKFATRILLGIFCALAYWSPGAAQVITSPPPGISNPAPNGTAAAPGIPLAGSTNSGLYWNIIPNMSVNGSGAYNFGASTFDITSASGALRFGGDTILLRDGGANIFACRNGTNACTGRIYNTYTDASNYERVSLGWASNQFNVTQEFAGTGSSRVMRFGTSTLGISLSTGSTPIVFGGGGGSSSGVTTFAELGSYGFTASTGSQTVVGITPTITQSGSAGYTALKLNVTESGTGSGTNRLLDLQIGGVTKFNVTNGGSATGINMLASDTGQIGMSTRSRLLSPSDGTFLATSNSGTSFGRLIMGTNDTSGISIIKNGTEVQAGLGDASALTQFAARSVRTTAVTVASLTACSAGNDGLRQFVTDATATTFASAVTGGGSNHVPVYCDGSGTPTWKIG